MDETLVVNLNQAGINGIRAAGATTQTIFVEGNSYTAASNWASVNDAMKSLTDPQGRLIYEMHLYLDSDGSGTHVDCVSTTIGVERAQGATAWLKANGKLGIIGANNQCNSAVAGLLEHLEANNDVWTGAMWWGGGPWV
jgi:endoglucanase